MDARSHEAFNKDVAARFQCLRLLLDVDVDVREEKSSCNLILQAISFEDRSFEGWSWYAKHPGRPPM